MQVTISRHAEYNKFFIETYDGTTVKEFIVYDVTITELGEFAKAITEEGKK